MPKSLFSKDYAVFLEVLIETRKKASLTQEQLAECLATTQSIISKCERGERRLDIVELRRWCNAIDIGLLNFIADFEERLSE
ncbi:helix-turn-helix domain-containing protein [Nostoc sp. LEGE 12450]|uniref:helix-turn-helix domain-containing protein n=1 Tax=Nostoc sp. LEGE 12450 TaxID=1828643 RepID=UPI0018803C56|nr:helix-turn-helix transcriptional regulator [Nostoc sp. LEGE 12450]MBE8987341.1 helix-turn-helix transcriptional regulator [Nostoc sp. LEGE 12450]